MLGQMPMILMMMLAVAWLLMHAFGQYSCRHWIVVAPLQAFLVHLGPLLLIALALHYQQHQFLVLHLQFLPLSALLYVVLFLQLQDSLVQGFFQFLLTVPYVDTIGVTSECLLLKNMFDPKLEMEPEFDLDIKEDVQDECSKFGRLKHTHVDKNSAGFVYLRFENTQSAISAQHGLHGRWFAGKMITATFMLPQNYEAKFPDS